MPRTIIAIRIDPFTRTVEPVEYDADDYRNLYPLLSAPEHPVDLFTTAYFNGPHSGRPTFEDEDVVFVDDEGLFKSPTAFFSLPGTAPLAGRGIILGTDADGDSVAPLTDIQWVRENVVFNGIALGLGRFA